MKKITTLLFVVLLTTLCLFSTAGYAQIKVATNWELSDSTVTLPSTIGTSDGTRGMAFGNLGSGERVFLVSRSSTDGNKIQVYDASTGAYVSALDMTGVSGGTFIMNDAGVTEDGVLLMANLASSTTLKVYKWNSESATPLNVISWSTGTSRYGDKITVTGNYSTGTARIYLLPNKTATGVKLQYFEMEQVGGVWQFKQTPSELSTSSLSIAGYPAVGLRTDGGFYLKAGGGNITQYDNTGAQIGGASSSSVVPPASSTVRYIKTVGDYDYLAYVRYYGGSTAATSAKAAANRVEIIKVPTTTGLADAQLVISTPSLGKNKNGNGAAGLVIKNIDSDKAEMYVLNTNNGVAKYTISGFSTLTGTNTLPNNDLKIYKSGNDVIVSGQQPLAIDVFNTSGQKVATATNADRVSVSGLKGIYVVKVVLPDAAIKTSKISL